jgi:hypothetical protein
VVPDDGGPPVVTAILAGPGALGPRFGGRLAHWTRAVHRRLHPQEDPGPARIPFELVRDIDDHVTLSARAGDLHTHDVERWVADHLIARLPGAGRADV